MLSEFITLLRNLWRAYHRLRPLGSHPHQIDTYESDKLYWY
jgi:hypothetical protein